MPHAISSARILKGVIFLLGVSIVLLAGRPTGGASANECSPMPPCPCAADGTCRPKRDTWGTYTTRWRTWPGETVGEQPTRAEVKGTTVREQLPTHVLPPANEEDLRGPARLPATSIQRAAPSAEEDSSPANPRPNPAPAEGMPLENFDLPGFDPQGSNITPRRSQSQATTPQSLIRVDDGPPALPTSLQDALTSSPATTAPAAVAPAVDVSHSASTPTDISSRIVVNAIPVDSAPQLPKSLVKPASAILLTNPAARSVVGDGEDLQQAIYYETSDSLGR